MNWDFLPYITGVLTDYKDGDRESIAALNHWDAQNYPTERRRLIYSMGDQPDPDEHGFIVRWDKMRPHPFYELARMVAFSGRRVPPKRKKPPQPVHPIIECPKTEQYTRLLAECFPDRCNLRVMEFGRLRARTAEILRADGGSTLQLAMSEKVSRVISIDPDNGTYSALMMWLPEKARNKTICLSEMDNHHRGQIDLLIVDANDCSWQNLDLMRSAERFLTPESIIAVDDQQHQVKPFLIREVLRDTHTERIIGDLAVFVPDERT